MPIQHNRAPRDTQVGNRVSSLHFVLITINPNMNNPMPKKKQKNVPQKATINAKVGEKNSPIIHNRKLKYTPLINLSPTKIAILFASTALSFIYPLNTAIIPIYSINPQRS